MSASLAALQMTSCVAHRGQPRQPAAAQQLLEAQEACARHDLGAAAHLAQRLGQPGPSWPNDQAAKALSWRQAILAAQADGLSCPPWAEHDPHVSPPSATPPTTSAP